MNLTFNEDTFENIFYMVEGILKNRTFTGEVSNTQQPATIANPRPKVTGVTITILFNHKDED